MAKKKEWTPEMLEVIQNKNLTLKQMAKILKKGPDNISRKRKEMWITKISEEKKKLISEMIGTLPIDYISRRVKVPIPTIRIYCDYKIKLIKEDELIKKFKEIPDIKELALYYNSSASEIRKKLLNIGLIEIKPASKRFSENEINFMLQNYKFLTNSEIAKKLNRNRTSIMTKMKELGIQGVKEPVLKKKEYSLWDWNGF